MVIPDLPHKLFHQLPEAPPPPDDPPPPEKLELPVLQDPPELREEILKPPIEVRPLVRKSFLAFRYQLEFLKSSFATGNIIK